MTPKSARHFARVLAPIASLLILSGCGSTPQVPSESPAALSFDDGRDYDFARNMSACLADYGWEVEAVPDGSIRTDSIPTGQEDTYAENLDSCSSRFGYEMDAPALDDGQLRELYKHVLWEWKCLNNDGQQPDTPPSEQTFIDTYHSVGSTWSAYDKYTDSKSPSELASIFEACPRST